MDIILGLAIFCFGFILATYFYAWRLKRAIRSLAKENNIDLDVDNVVNVKDSYSVPVFYTDCVADNTILLYDNKNNFLCQGSNIDEIAQNLGKNKSIIKAVIRHDGDVFWFAEGKAGKV